MSDRKPIRRLAALDGIRGFLSLFLLSYHFGLTQLKGSWLTINVFFVLSGFLIVRLVVQERARSGRIDFLGFYARRARRLFPALGVLLAVILVYGLAFAPDAERGPLRWDIFATMGYFMNWRLFAQSNQYFVEFTEPSPLQHAWSLSVEEQFYLVIPLLLVVLMALLHTRRALVAVLLGLAVVSAIWMAIVGVGSDAAKSHFYYGTDTRAQSLLLGAALGVLLARFGSSERRNPLPVKQVQLIGWSGCVITVVATAVVAPQTSAMANGGMFLLSLATVAWVWAIADERGGSLQRCLAVKPLSALGRMSYGVYLWHWPVGLWLLHVMPDQPVVLRVVAGCALTIGIATLSYQRIERPIHDRGWGAVAGGVLRARTIAVAAVVALFLGAVGMHGDVAAASEGPLASAPAPALVAGQPAYTPPKSTKTIAVFGDSVPDRLAKYYPSSEFKNLRLVDAASSGCDLLDTPYYNPGNGDLEPLRTDCVAAKKAWPKQLEGTGTKLLLLFPTKLLLIPHQIDGQRHALGDAVFDKAVTDGLNTVAAGAKRAGARVAVVTMPCYDPQSSADIFLQTMRQHAPDVLHGFAHPAKANDLARQWARAHGAPVIDLQGAVCGSGDTPTRPHGFSLYADGVHFSPWGSKVVWKWLAPQAIRVLDGMS